MGEQILITGITGCSGGFLARHLLQSGIEVSGLARNINNLHNLEDITAGLSLFSADLRDFSQVEAVVREVRPTQVYHLAAQQGPFTYSMYETNCIGTINLLEALRKLKSDVSILIVGSSSQYGAVSVSHFPIGEDQALRPVNHYGVSKACEELSAYPYIQNKKMRIIFTRTFNLVGPRLEGYLACSSFACQIAWIEKNGQPPVIEVGNIETSRDFVDVRDAVIAYILLMEKGYRGEIYNICSGKAVTIKEIIEILISFSRVKIEFKVVQDRIKASDIPGQAGSYDKLFRLTGWRPKIELRQSLRDLLEWWRRRI